MREIKFRAWNGKHMVAACRVVDGYFQLQGGRNDGVFMQFTGLKDKSGVDIYEGDIGFDDKLGIYADIYFESGSFWFGAVLLCTEAELLTIAGNIHENPELLGK